MTPSSCRLYLITPPRLRGIDDIATFAPLLASALDAGDVACVQLRMKEAEDGLIRDAVARLGPICQERDIAFILNDDPALAADTGCDGVHIGADDPSLSTARERMGPNGIVGVSCYNSRHLAMEAAEDGADYVAFGAFFPSTTKPPPARAEIDLIAWWAEMMTVPVVAIGGITPENCPPLVAAGCDFLAVSAGVFDHPGGPAGGVAAFDAAIAAALDKDAQ